MTQAPKKMSVLGKGAIGLAIASRSALAKQKIQFVDGRISRPVSASADCSWNGYPPQKFRFDVAPPSRLNNDFDPILVCVRANDLPAACASLLGTPLENHPLLVLTNGMGILDEVQHKGRLIRGSLFFGATLKTERSIDAFGDPDIAIARDGANDMEFEKLKTYLTEAGLSVREFATGKELEWRKLPINLVVNLIATLEDSYNGVILERIELVKKAQSVLAEYADVLKAQSFGAVGDLEELVFSSIEKHDQNINSTLVDIRKKRQLELPFIAGRFLEAAASSGIATPVTKGLYDAVLAKAR